MILVERNSLRKLLMFPAVSAVVLMSLISMESRAGDADGTCPCFNYGEVESIFQKGVQPTEEEYLSDCSAQDYSVEFNAEVIVWDQDYTIVAQARVEWFDFDLGGCEYIDTIGDPDVERTVKWPDSNPEAPARDCYNIIARVIAKLDTSGKCNTSL